jgi:hypothetical protein
MLRLPRRRREPPPVLFPGVMFRISTPDGVIVETSSQHLYYSAKYAGPEPCTPACPPGCQKHGWFNLITGRDHEDYARFGPSCPAGEFSVVPLKIEVKPVRLADLPGDA